MFCREPGWSVSAPQQCIISVCIVSDSPIFPFQGHVCVCYVDVSWVYETVHLFYIVPFPYIVVRLLFLGCVLNTMLNLSRRSWSEGRNMNSLLDMDSV